MERFTYLAGDSIFEQDDESECAYMVMTGTVQIDREGFTAILEAGELFGEAALVNRPRMARASAKTDCVLMAVSTTELLDTIRSQPDTAVDIVKAMFVRLELVIDELNSLRKYHWKRL
jgi:CRP-like cAMP-binding protein